MEFPGQECRSLEDAGSKTELRSVVSALVSDSEFRGWLVSTAGSCCQEVVLSASPRRQVVGTLTCQNLQN